ncbi:MAG: xanthine dehydrogenase family protein subunit M [Deltaproteobacteria bacterium]|uniref:FAD binding domain-containing protein n=1 Tax=Desulfobacula sp. TaxID=2593537 RepID=UPI0019A63DB5|nr:xanthine dehydrogenase family protein subunit M [Candidatus Desulfobacula maris]MBL6993743.1 xanthine dehydrogenase family protein subunit M [Desulfobacula sp.]
MDNFKYFPAKDVTEACALLARYGEEAKALSGGQSLVSMMKEKFISPSYIIDIKGISDLDYIRYTKDDGLRIGGLTTHRSVEKSDIIREKFFMLAEMEYTLASVAVRNWGTVGGNLCSADPASDLAPTLIALGAQVTLTGVDTERVVRLEEFFVDSFETILNEDEILTEIHIPNAIMSGGIHTKFARRATDLAVVSVATYLTLDVSNHDLCKDIRIVMGSVNPIPSRSKRAEELIKGQKINDVLIEKAAQIASEDIQPTADLNGTEEFKRDIARVLVQRTIKEAAVRARTL